MVIVNFWGRVVIGSGAASIHSLNAKVEVV